MAKRKSLAAIGSALRLDQRLAAIGVMVTADRITKRDISRVDIEQTLVDAALTLGKDDGEFRLLGPLLSWVSIHGSAVIIEKLMKLLNGRKQDGCDLSIAGLLGHLAVAHGHKRWLLVAERFSPPAASPRLLGPADMAPSLLRVRGEEEWARGTGFLVPKGLGAVNPKWVLSKKALGKQHAQYRNRLIYGAQWRADIITVYELGARTATEASRATGASYEPCHRVKSDLEAAGILSAGE